MATYKQIQDYVKNKHGYIPKSCWIAHVKEICGLNPKTATNRQAGVGRAHPCPKNKQDDLRQAFLHFELI